MDKFIVIFAIAMKYQVKEHINLPLKYVASTYEAYHTLSFSQCVERLLEAKNISFKEEDIDKRG